MLIFLLTHSKRQCLSPESSSIDAITGFPQGLNVRAGVILILNPLNYPSRGSGTVWNTSKGIAIKLLLQWRTALSKASSKSLPLP